ncbi:transglycosylase domain-containing protein [Segatella bryantii]|uniref:transglycosylase domain-containing protein n=1 Tax=Segatella bryantii TaxID=77095 RepID=UPI001EDBBDAD|nr:transglycosylase domain-containing protein [Segatella bryantii]UKK76749.1 transglycosylase domain-containing protein [Segatella bryantii]
MFDKIKRFLQWAWVKLKAFWPWYKGLYVGRAWYTKCTVAFASLIVFFFLYLGAVDINFLWLFGKSPGYFSGILNPQTNEASEIYSADGKLIGKYFNENRSPVKYEEVNPYFFKALIDTEDERFYKHMGIDPIGIFGAVKDAVLHHDGRGASTITQQLAKNMFRVRSQYSTGLLGKVPGLKILIVKSKEWIIATKLETVFSKKEIITMYANTVDFGSNSYGIKTAAKTYFNTTPKELSIDQAAILVGMLKATSYYNPKTNPENSLKRRNTVLMNMVNHGDLDRAQMETLSKMPIDMKDFKVEENYDGQALYFREAISDYLKDWCNENGYDLYSSGLKIYTTIDTRMQKYAEDAANKQMKIIQQNFDNHWSINRKQETNWMRQEPWVDENGKVIPNFIQQVAERQPFYKELLAKYPNNPDSVNYYYKEWKHPVEVFDYNKGKVTKIMTSEDSIKYMTSFMHCAMVAMEPQTGEVKAWVGDINFKTWKYDKATAQRQPGSTFKLFVYTEAMNQGLTPCDKRRDEYISMEVYDKKKHEMTTWTPGNANGSFSGDSMPLKSAFAKSINSVAVRLGQEMGIKRIIETAQKMGVKSKLDEEPSLALGSSDVNLLEMVNAYSVIADNGKHHDPVLVTRIVDKDGNEVYQGPTTDEQVIPYKSAFLMQQLLQGGMKEPGGTSQSLWGYVGSFKDTDFGGKTGTSNNHSDAWFMCVSPKIVVGAWVGGEYRSIHFRTGALGQGSRTALPICGYFMQALLKDPEFQKYHGRFDKPHDEDITRDMYECASYVPTVKRDTTRIDTTMTTAEEILLDENGNPIIQSTEEKSTGEEDNSSKSSSVPSISKTKKKKATEEQVNFDDL